MKVALITNPSPVAHYFAGKISSEIPLDGIYIEAGKKRSASRPTLRKILSGIKRNLLGNQTLADLERRMERQARRRYFPDFSRTIRSTLMPETTVDIHAEEFLEHLRKEQYDMIVLFGTSIVKKPLLEIPRCATLNIHTSLLPYYKGTMPEFWQLYYEDYAHCGSTVHYVESGVDTGNILLQEPVEVEAGDTFFDLRYKNILKAIELLPEAITLASSGEPGVVQPSVTQEVFRASMVTDEKKRELYRRLGWRIS